MAYRLGKIAGSVAFFVPRRGLDLIRRMDRWDAGSQGLGKRKVLSEAEINQLVLPEPGQLLGLVTELLGYDRMRVKCADGEDRVCRVRGKMKRRVWIKMGDTVLVAPWDFQKGRGDILWRYTAAQAQLLEKRGLLPARAAA